MCVCVCVCVLFLVNIYIYIYIYEYTYIMRNFLEEIDFNGMSPRLWGFLCLETCSYLHFRLLVFLKRVFFLHIMIIFQ